MSVVEIGHLFPLKCVYVGIIFDLFIVMFILVCMGRLIGGDICWIVWLSVKVIAVACRMVRIIDGYFRLYGS